MGTIKIPKSSKNSKGKKILNEETDGIRSTQSSNIFDHIANENK
jgi:hypothetical protein